MKKITHSVVLPCLILVIIALATISCEDSQNKNLVSPVKQEIQEDNNGSVRLDYGDPIDYDFCPWCVERIFPTAGSPPIPIPGSPTNFNSVSPSDPNMGWSFDQYAADSRFKGFIYNLNPEEISFFRRSPFRIPTAYANMQDAVKMTDRFYVQGQSNNSNANAFKHAYWSKLNALSWGSEVARQYGVAHESSEPKLNMRNMDLHNNNLGINTLGNVTGFPPPGRPENAFFTINILKAIRNGQGIRLVNNEDDGAMIRTNKDGER